MGQIPSALDAECSRILCQKIQPAGAFVEDILVHPGWQTTSHCPPMSTNQGAVTKSLPEVLETCLMDLSALDAECSRVLCRKIQPARASAEDIWVNFDFMKTIDLFSQTVNATSVAIQLLDSVSH